MKYQDRQTFQLQEFGTNDPCSQKESRPKTHEVTLDRTEPSDPPSLANALAERPNFRATILQLWETCKFQPSFTRQTTAACPNIFSLDEEVVELRPKLSLCMAHMEPQGCVKRLECKDLHICQNFVMKSCSDTGCVMGHNWHTRHNISVLRSLHLQMLDTEVLRRLLISSNTVPNPHQLNICHNYNQGNCKQENCQDLHVCIKFVSSRTVCLPADCHLNHNLLMPECCHLLEAHGIDTDEAPRDILLSLLETNPSLLQHKQPPADDTQNIGSDGLVVETLAQQDSSTPGGTSDQEETRNASVRKTLWVTDLDGNSVIPEICVFSVEGACEYEETGCLRLHSSQHFNWQVSEQGSNWLNLMPLQVNCLERAFCNPGHDGVGIPPLNPHNLDPSRSELLILLGREMWMANFQAMILISQEEAKILYIRRLSSEIIPGYTAKQSIYRWFRCDGNKEWTQYPDEESFNLESGITSEGLESQYLVNPNDLVSFKRSDTTYSVNFNDMTETEEGTEVVRSVRRRPRPHLGQITEAEREAVAASLYQEPVAAAAVRTPDEPDWDLEAIVAALYDQDEQLLATIPPQEGT